MTLASNDFYNEVSGKMNQYFRRILWFIWYKVPNVLCHKVLVNECSGKSISFIAPDTLSWNLVGRL